MADNSWATAKRGRIDGQVAPSSPAQQPAGNSWATAKRGRLSLSDTEERLTSKMGALEDAIAEDAARKLASGAANMVDSFVALGQYAGVPGFEKLREHTRDAPAFWTGGEKLSPRQRAEDAKLKAFADGGDWSNLSARNVGMTLVESLPMIVPGFGAANLAVRAGAKAAGTALAAGGAEAAVGGAFGAQQAGKLIEDAPEEALAASVPYQTEYHALPATMDDTARRVTARKNLAAKVAIDSALLTGAITGMLGTPAGAAYYKLLRGKGGSLLARTAKGAKVEALEEAGQSYGEQVVQNKAVQENIDPDQPLTKGAFRNAVVGGLAAAPLGAGFGAMSPANPVKDEKPSQVVLPDVLPVSPEVSAEVQTEQAAAIATYKRLQQLLDTHEVAPGVRPQAENALRAALSRLQELGVTADQIAPPDGPSGGGALPKAQTESPWLVPSPTATDIARRSLRRPRIGVEELTPEDITMAPPQDGTPPGDPPDGPSDGSPWLAPSQAALAMSRAGLSVPRVNVTDLEAEEIEAAPSPLDSGPDSRTASLESQLAGLAARLNMRPPAANVTGEVFPAEVSPTDLAPPIDLDTDLLSDYEVDSIPISERIEIADRPTARTVADIHALADSKGIAWNNDKVFMDLTLKVTGKRHLDALTPAQLEKMYQRLNDQAAAPPVLESYSEEDLARREVEKVAAEKKRTEQDRKADAGAKLPGFTLTGSDRDADVGAAAGQQDALGNSPMPESFAAEKKDDSLLAPEFQTGPNETYLKGDKARYTGKSEMLHGKRFYEVEMLEGVHKGKMKVVGDAPKQAPAQDYEKPVASSGELTPSEIAAADRKAESRIKLAEKARVRYQKESRLDPKNDDVLAAVAKLGGLDRDEAQAQGIDPANFRKTGWKIKRIFTKGGKSFDGMAEALDRYGYPVQRDGRYDANELLNIVARALMGDRIASNEGVIAVEQEEYFGEDADLAQKFDGDQFPITDDEIAALLEDSIYGLSEEERRGLDAIEASNEEGRNQEAQGAAAEKGDERVFGGPRDQGEGESAPTLTAINTEDAGAELAYNRRNRIRTGIKWDDIVDKNETLRVSETTKSNVYPKPDYDALIAGGMQPIVAHIVKQVYDSISAKPKTKAAPTDADLRTYIEGVNRVMAGVMSWVNDSQAIGQWAQSQVRVAGAMLGKPTVLSDLGEESKSLLEFVYPGGWRQYTNEIRIVGNNKVMRALQPGMDETKRALKAVNDGWPTSQKAWEKSFVIEAKTLSNDDVPEAERNGEPQERFFIMQKAAKWRFAKGQAEGGYASYDEAVEAAVNLTKRESKTQVSDKGISVESAERLGEARRMEGENVSSDKLRDTFGFKGVNFGTWMKGDTNLAERQLHLNHAYDSFMDLADILGVPHKAMSLNGMLGVAIGAQGNGKYAAHFVPGLNEINLTRTSGAGSLAHEFGHAVDHYFATQANLAKSREPFLTEHVDNVKAFGEGIRPEIVAAFKTIVNAMNKKQESPAQVQARLMAAKEKSSRYINNWLAAIKRDFIAQQVDAAKFDALAERITSLDLGDGVILAGNVHISPAVDELRTLYKAKTGRVYSLDQIKGLQANIDHAVYLKSDRAAERTHVPQQVATDYATAAAALDKGKSGKKYWSTNLEKFARAFDAFVSDTLAEKAAKNTYLSHADRAGETVPAGEERTVINKAFQTLVDTIDTRDTDTGTVLYSRPKRALTEAFKRWFGDSKVVDENGDPLVVYHGTASANITEFLPQALGSRYEGRSHELVEWFRRIKAENGKIGYMDFRSGIFFSQDPSYAGNYTGEDGGVMYPVYIKAEHPVYIDQVTGNVSGPSRTPDALIFRDGDTINEIAVLDPAQIKSATGNRGTFDPSDTDIRHSKSRGTNAKGLSLAEVQSVVNEAVSKLGPVRIRVVATESDLPERLQPPQGERPYALYDNGDVWVIASNHDSRKSVATAVAHEVFGHLGPMETIDNWAEVTKMVNTLIRSKNPRAVAIARELNERYPDETPGSLVYVREFIALAAEKKHSGSIARLLSVVRAAIRRFLRSIGLRSSMADGDIDIILRDGELFLRAGGVGQAEAALRSDSGQVAFYSQLLRAINASPMAKATPEQWQAMLKKSGVKDEELNWMDVDGFMAGKKTVSREELSEFVRSNQVTVREVVKGEIDIDDIPDGWEIIASDDGSGGYTVVDEDGEERGGGGTSGLAVQSAINNLSNSNPPKFGQWQTPGGENYRELLVTLPEDQNAAASARSARVKELIARREQLKTDYESAKPGQARQDITRLIENTGRQIDMAMRETADPTAFRSSHFAEPNIAVHIRFNERTDVDGKRVLFVEEVQSDWALKGRKVGYARNDASFPLDRIKVLPPGNQYSELTWAVELPEHIAGRNLFYGTTKEEAIGNAREFWIAPTNHVPDMPFKKSWPLLGMKHAIKWAVENGFDKVAWTTGEMQADRYDLSKKATRIQWNSRDDNDANKDVAIELIRGNDIAFVVEPDGSVQGPRGGGSGAEFDGKNISDVIGKDLGERLLSEDNGDLHGEGLRIGGAGMKGFYDQILPAEVNKYVKKWGAKVGLIEIEVGDPYTSSSKLQFLGDVPGFDITPAMRDSVLKGQPLFSRASDRKQHRWKSVIQTAKGPMFVGPDVSLFPTMSFPTKWNTTGYDVLDPRGARIGKAVLKTDGNEITDLYWIEAKEKRTGMGHKVMRAIAASNTGPVAIHSILDEARAFWDAQGAHDYVGQDKPTARITWAEHARKTNGRTAGLPRLGGVNDGRSNRSADRRGRGDAERAEAGLDEEILYSRQEPTVAQADTKPPTGWVAEQDEAMQETLRKSGAWRGDLTTKARVKSWTADWKQKLRQGVVDQFDAIKNYDYNAYMLARMSRGSDGALESLVNSGTLKMDADGAIDVNFEKGGFFGILSGLNGEHERFMAWVIGMRAARLIGEGKEHNLTEDDIERLKTLAHEKMADGKLRSAVYLKAAADLTRYNKSVVDIAVRSGLIDEDSREFWEKDFYIPFYRLMEDDGTKGPVRAPGLVRQYAFKTLKGGPEVIGDPLQNILSNWSHLLDASLKNNAAVKALEAAEQVGAAHRTAAGTKDAVFVMGRSIETIPKGQKYTDGGVELVSDGTAEIDVHGKVYYAVDDPFLLDAISSLGFSGFQGAGMQAMQSFKRWLTIGVTQNPAYRIRNIIRDSLSTIGTTQASYNVLGNLMSGWAGTVEGSPEYASIIAGGGVIRFGSILDGDRARHAKRLIESGIDDQSILDTPTKAKDALQAAWDWWQKVGDRAENVNRVALYKKLRLEGKSHLEASYAARDVLDFSTGGQWAAIRFLIQTVPFMNSRIQGLYKLGRGAAEDPRRLMAVTGMVALASIALLLAYKDDEDWKAREDWDRETYWWFKIGNMSFRIPKPFELGMIGTMAERALETLISDEFGGEELAASVWNMTMNQLSMNPVPQVFKPAVEVWANENSFTDRPIETMGMENLSTGERYSNSTSATARLVGKAGVLSPVQVDHLIRGYFAWLGTSIVAIADQAVGPVVGVNTRPERKIDDLFVVGSFIKALPAYQSMYVTDFYDSAEKAQRVMADIRHYEKIGAIEKAIEIRKDKNEWVAVAPMYTRAQRQLLKLNQHIRRAEASSMDPEAKRKRLDFLYKMRNRLAEITERRADASREKTAQ